VIVTTLLVAWQFASGDAVCGRSASVWRVVFPSARSKEVITEPGLRFKLPQPFQNVSVSWIASTDAGRPEQVLSKRLKERKPGEVDWRSWVKEWQITDQNTVYPVTIRVNSIQTAEARLTSIGARRI
jgi:hypothetical protein